MQSFDIKKYGATVGRLVDPHRPVDLGPGSPELAIASELMELGPNDLFGDQRIVDMEMAECCLSALWLWNDFLDESHHISQSVDTQTGSYWHGIMHRREPDYSNAKYWFRRVGNHAIFSKLSEAVQCLDAEVGSLGLTNEGSWDPFAFVDLCQKAAQRDAEWRDLCQQITRMEWELLFDYCYESAM